MTQTATIGAWRVEERPEHPSRTRASPEPVRAGPVLIHDAVIPAGAATLLLKLWQRWDDRNDRTGKDSGTDAL